VISYIYVPLIISKDSTALTEVCSDKDKHYLDNDNQSFEIDME